MALIHHQFESIHPFYDGNGRTGRVLNILFLVKEGLLGSPILYLSRYINQSKPRYYDLLNKLFRHPYTKIELLVQALGVTRKTAYKYLEDLIEAQLVSKHKIGKENFYLNEALFNHLKTPLEENR